MSRVGGRHSLQPLYAIITALSQGRLATIY